MITQCVEDFLPQFLSGGIQISSLSSLAKCQFKGAPQPSIPMPHSLKWLEWNSYWAMLSGQDDSEQRWQQLGKEQLGMGGSCMKCVSSACKDQEQIKQALAGLLFYTTQQLHQGVVVSVTTIELSACKPMAASTPHFTTRAHSWSGSPVPDRQRAQGDPTGKQQQWASKGQRKE